MKAAVIVIGGGHNGLTAAALIARSGREVTLVERREVLGGVAAGEEFHPGFRTTGLLTETAALRPGIAAKLGLERHGLEFVDTPPRVALEREGPGLLVDGEGSIGEIAARSPGDVAAFESWTAFLARVRGFVARVLSEAPPELDPSGAGQVLELLRTGVALRRLGEADMLELLRVGPMAAADWMKDTFESPLLRAALAAPALQGTWLGPWSAGSAALLLGQRCTQGRTVRGGPAALAEVLSRAARDAGVKILAGRAVTRVLVDAGAVRGVELAGGEVLEAGAIAASIEPSRLFLELVERLHLPPELEQAARTWRTRGTTAKVHLALDGPLEAPGRGGAPIEHMTTGESIDELERAFDAVKYGGASERPLLDIRVPTLSAPGLAPEGKHVASILVHYAPHALAGGWTAQAKADLEASVLKTLEEVLPGTAEKTLACETLTPADLEARYGLTGGHVHHGEHALDQLAFLRPTLDCGHYATPIRGLFLCGSGSHPGGGITCAPGMLGAARCLEAP